MLIPLSKKGLSLYRLRVSQRDERASKMHARDSEDTRREGSVTSESRACILLTRWSPAEIWDY